MEPMAGIEPATDGLRNRCSTAELHWLHCLRFRSGRDARPRPRSLGLRAETTPSRGDCIRRANPIGDDCISALRRAVKASREACVTSSTRAGKVSSLRLERLF